MPVHNHGFTIFRGKRLWIIGKSFVPRAEGLKSEYIEVWKCGEAKVKSVEIRLLRQRTAHVRPVANSRDGRCCCWGWSSAAREPTHSRGRPDRERSPFTRDLRRVASGHIRPWAP